MKGEFVGKCKPMSHTSFVEKLKYEQDPFNDDDEEDDDGQLSADVVADNILPGLCLLF